MNGVQKEKKYPMLRNDLQEFPNEHYIAKAKEYLAPAYRQYKHNYGSDGFVAGFDFQETIRLVANLIEVAKLGMGNHDDK